ncbi:hypothetical protein G9A89_001824 [Geosiphon pyriformis]|nr:hypothetical protein G9A89_001824 [Geosiphon pyriformis]
MEKNLNLLGIKQNKKDTLKESNTIIYSSKELLKNSQKCQSENRILQIGPIFQRKEKLNSSSIVKRHTFESTFPTKKDEWIFERTRSLLARSSTSDKRKENKYKKLLNKPREKELISEFSKYAFYAQEAYCLSGEFGKLAEGFYAYAFQPKRKSMEIIIYFKGEPINFNERSKIMGTLDTISYEKFDNGKKKLLEIIEKFMGSGKTKNYIFKLTGHGEGGAYAVFAGLHLRSIYGSTVTVFTFGEPRIGTYAMAKYVDQNIKVFRITNRDDNVPRFQPISKYFPYIHHSTEYWISSDNEPCDCRNTMVPENDTDAIMVYECSRIPKFVYWIPRLTENPYCNLQEIDQGKGGEDISTNFDYISESHWGPYFGYKMGVCPKNQSY